MSEANTTASFLAVRINWFSVRLALGIAAFYSWVYLLFCFEGLLRDMVAYGGGVVHDPLFLGACLTASLLLLGVLFATKKRMRLPLDSKETTKVAAEETEYKTRARRWQLLMIVFAVVGALAGVFGVYLSAVAPLGQTGLKVAAALAGIVAGIFIAAYTLEWGEVVLALDMRKALVALGVAFCLQWIPFIAVELMGTAFKALLAFVLPLVSGWCLVGFFDERNISEGVAKAPKNTQAQTTDKAIIGRVAGASFVFSFVAQFSWTCNVVMTTEPLDESLFWVVFALIFVATTLSVGIIMAFVNRWRAYRTELFYRVAFVFGVAGSAALGLAATHLFVSYSLAYIAYALIMPTMWMLAWSIVFMRKGASRPVIGWVFGLQFLGLPLGFAVARGMQEFAGITVSYTMLPYASLFATVLLTLTYVFVLPERTLMMLSPRLFKLSHESIDERCHDIATQYALTAREAEILGFLARGRDVGYIEKELFISRNTVNTHRKNLYRKLGIHTQQELLSLLEDTLD